MHERPILFSAAMVRAILAGTKIQTRRAMRPQPPDGWFNESPDEVREIDAERMDVTPRWLVERCPHGKPGDRLWVRETWVSVGEGGPHHAALYRADGVDLDGRWRPSIFMPRWASRITLELVEVRVQRLWDITDDDAKAEGVKTYTPRAGHISPDQRVRRPGFRGVRIGDQPHRLPFADLWDRINGKRRRRELCQLGERGYPGTRTVVDTSAAWAANPWVWALTFRRVT